MSNDTEEGRDVRKDTRRLIFQMDKGEKKGYIRVLAKANILTLSMLILVIIGCSTTLTDEERLWRQGIDAENWAMCEMAYQQWSIPTYHKDHVHNIKRGPVKPYYIHSDLIWNSCKRAVGDYWIEY